MLLLRVADDQGDIVSGVKQPIQLHFAGGIKAWAQQQIFWRIAGNA